MLDLMDKARVFYITDLFHLPHKIQVSLWNLIYDMYQLKASTQNNSDSFFSE